MKFTKEELNFLGIYNVCSDTKNPLSDKLQIQASKDGKVVFSLHSTEADLVTELNNNDGEEFSVIYPLFLSLAVWERPH